MRLPKYKQPMLDIYNETDFSKYGLTPHQRKVYDTIFLTVLKSSYCLTSVDLYDKDDIKILKEKGLINNYGGSLISVKIVDDVLKEYRKKTKRAEQ